MGGGDELLVDCRHASLWLIGMWVNQMTIDLLGIALGSNGPESLESSCGKTARINPAQVR
jgi:hypothetical protein